MAIHARLDSACSPTTSALIVFAIFLLLTSGHAFSQAMVPAGSKAENVKALYDAHRWREVVRIVPESSAEPADLELYRGLALAQLWRYPEAERAFLAGHAGHPKDARFLTEMAGIAYRDKRFSTAKNELRHALAIDPKDDYSNNFLASIYFLEGNLEAALKYWNRAGKPKLADLTYDPNPRLDPLILDRAFLFSPGRVWGRNQFLTTRAELESLQLFPRMFFDLEAQPDGSFKLLWHNSERSGWRGWNVPNVASMLRGLPYQSVYPEFYNLNHKGLNWLSFVRWDDEKRRLSSEIMAPLPQGPQRRFRIYFDGRNENWNISRTLAPGMPSSAGMNMERVVAGAEIQSIASWRTRWTLGGEYSYRKFRTLVGIPQQAASFFTGSSGIAVRSGVQYALIRFPERRFMLDSAATAELGKFTANPLGRYGRIAGSLAADWLPEARGDDYEMQTKLRASRTFGQVPFDDLYMLGFDRDSDLWMRGHDGLADGKKGNAPLGRNFILSNSDIDKIVYQDGLFKVKLGTFLDTGDIYDPSKFFGSSKWLTDTGIQAKVGLLGSFEFVLGYGKDLRSGNNTFYTTVLR